MSFLDSILARLGYVRIEDMNRRLELLRKQLNLSAELLKKAIQLNTKTK